MPAVIVILFILGFLIGLYAIFIHYKTKILKVVSHVDIFAHLDKIAPVKRREQIMHQTPDPSSSVPSTYVKVVVFVPDAHANQVREAIGEAGGGAIGNYSFTSFSTAGIGRFRPEPGSHPRMGTIGTINAVEEERIEFTTSRSLLPKVVKAIKAVHPYEELVIDVYSLENI